MNTELVKRVTSRMRAGMSSESAYGLEWRLMREREGFDGDTWSRSTRRDAGSSNPRAFRDKMAVLRYLQRGEAVYSEICDLIGHAKASNALTDLNKRGRVGKRGPKGSIRFYITQRGIDWLNEHTKQGGLFDE